MWNRVGLNQTVRVGASRGSMARQHRASVAGSRGTPEKGQPEARLGAAQKQPSCTHPAGTLLRCAMAWSLFPFEYFGLISICSVFPELFEPADGFSGSESSLLE
jgi:hypothetical protein